MKRCTACLKLKKESSFNRDAAGKNGLKASCRTCCNERSMRWYKRNQAKAREQARHYAKHNVQRKRQHRRSSYSGWTRVAFEESWLKQYGKCAICDVRMLKSGVAYNSVTADHCHKRLKTRGLLCRSCNTGIGFMKDSIDVLRNAIRYIAKHS